LNGTEPGITNQYGDREAAAGGSRPVSGHCGQLSGRMHQSAAIRSIGRWAKPGCPLTCVRGTLI